MSRELFLLGLLRHADMHGYQLNEFIARDLSTCTDIKKPTAYFLLRKMAEQGWICEAEDRQGNRPVRRVYSITPEGESAFHHLLRSSLAEYQPVAFNGDLSLAFITELPQSEALDLLQQRRIVMQQFLSDLQEIPPHEAGFKLVIEHQRHHLRSELDWLDQVITNLRQSAIGTHIDSYPEEKEKS